MSPHTLPHVLRRLEGSHVSVALRDGTRLDDCEVVSVARRRHGGTIWLLVGGDDHILPVDQVLAVDSLPAPAPTPPSPVGLVARYPPG